MISVVEWAYIVNAKCKDPNGSTSSIAPKNRIVYEYAEFADLNRLEMWYKINGLIFPEAFICLPARLRSTGPRYTSPAKNGWDLIVHGDIKQENLFLTTPDGNIHRLYPSIKLADFGLAHTTGGPVTAVQHFRSCHQYGTDGYIAPEIEDNTLEVNLPQRMPHELHGPHSDTFSLGMTCRHLLSLVDLHKPKSAHHERSKFGLDQPHEDYNLHSFYSDELRCLSERCMAEDPRDRPKTTELYVEAKAQMEIHRSMAYIDATTAIGQEETTKVFHSRVLYTQEDQRRYETDSVFWEGYRRANLRPIWTLMVEKIPKNTPRNKPRPKLITTQSFRSERGRDEGGEGLFSAFLRKSISWKGPSQGPDAS